MNPASCRNLFIPALLSGLLLASDPAHALRCDGKLIREGMLDIEVQEYCGEPTAIRDRGFVVRSFTLFELQRARREIHAVRFGPGNFLQHVLVTEFIYNLGPSKLMRRLTFEDGILTDVETLGYGYLEKRH
jgi:hypothetical protein